MENPLEQLKLRQQRLRKGEGWKMFLELFEKELWPLVQEAFYLGQGYFFDEYSSFYPNTYFYFKEPSEICLALKIHLKLSLRGMAYFEERGKEFLKFLEYFIIVLDKEVEFALNYAQYELDRREAERAFNIENDQCQLVNDSVFKQILGCLYEDIRFYEHLKERWDPIFDFEVSIRLDYQDISELRKKVKKTQNPRQTWVRLSKRFQILSYKKLKKKNLPEAMEWVDNCDSMDSLMHKE